MYRLSFVDMVATEVQAALRMPLELISHSFHLAPAHDQ